MSSSPVDWYFAQFLDYVGLLTLQVSDLGAYRGRPRCGSVLDGRLVSLAGGEQGIPVRAEDAAGEEAADQFEELVLADPQALGLRGEPVLAGVVGGYGLAGAVAVAAGNTAGLAVEAPPAQDRGGSLAGRCAGGGG